MERAEVETEKTAAAPPPAVSVVPDLFPAVMSTNEEGGEAVVGAGLPTSNQDSSALESSGFDSRQSFSFGRGGGAGENSDGQPGVWQGLEDEEGPIHVGGGRAPNRRGTHATAAYSSGDTSLAGATPLDADPSNHLESTTAVYHEEEGYLDFHGNPADEEDDDDIIQLHQQRSTEPSGHDTRDSEGTSDHVGDGSVSYFSRPVSSQGGGWGSSMASPVGFAGTPHEEQAPGPEQQQPSSLSLGQLQHGSFFLATGAAERHDSPKDPISQMEQAKMRLSQMPEVLAPLEEHPAMAGMTACERERNPKHLGTLANMAPPVPPPLSSHAVSTAPEVAHPLAEHVAPPLVEVESAANAAGENDSAKASTVAMAAEGEETKTSSQSSYPPATLNTTNVYDQHMDQQEAEHGHAPPHPDEKGVAHGERVKGACQELHQEPHATSSTAPKGSGRGNVVLHVTVTNIYTGPDESILVNPDLYTRHPSTGGCAGDSVLTSQTQEGKDENASQLHSLAEGNSVVKRHGAPSPNIVVVQFPVATGLERVASALLPAPIAWTLQTMVSLVISTFLLHMRVLRWCTVTVLLLALLLVVTAAVDVVALSMSNLWDDPSGQ